MKRRGKLVALSTAAVGIVVLVAAGIVAKDRIWEEWYLWKLEKGSDQEQQLAADGLGEMRSVRSIPVLVAKLKQEAIARANSFASRWNPVGVTPDAAAWRFYKGSVKKFLGERAVRFQDALVKIGKPATLALLKARIEHVKEGRPFGMTLAWILPLVQIHPCTPAHPGHDTSCQALVLQHLRDDLRESPEIRQAAEEVLMNDPTCVR